MQKGWLQMPQRIGTGGPAPLREVRMLRELPQAAVMPLLSLLAAIGGGAAERAAVGEQGGASRAGSVR